jgi:hypothetical protein
MLPTLLCFNLQCNTKVSSPSRGSFWQSLRRKAHVGLKQDTERKTWEDWQIFIFFPADEFQFVSIICFSSSSSWFASPLVCEPDLQWMRRRAGASSSRFLQHKHNASCCCYCCFFPPLKLSPPPWWRKKLNVFVSACTPPVRLLVAHHFLPPNQSIYFLHLLFVIILLYIHVMTSFHTCMHVSDY